MLIKNLFERFTMQHASNPCKAGRTCRYHTTEASHSDQGCGTNLITKLAKVHLKKEQNGVEV